jgi:hypothetical protein
LAQEFFINSENLESQVRKLLPSQGGAGAGFDLSASTQIIPIIDLTESAEGSNIRQDLQTAMDFATSFNSVTDTTTTLITTTGFFRVFGTSVVGRDGNIFNKLFLDDGSTTKTVFQDSSNDSSVNRETTTSVIFDFVVFLSAGISLKAETNETRSTINVSTRQIASIDGTLTNPLGF